MPNILIKDTLVGCDDLDPLAWMTRNDPFSESTQTKAYSLLI